MTATRVTTRRYGARWYPEDLVEMRFLLRSGLTWSPPSARVLALSSVPSVGTAGNVPRRATLRGRGHARDQWRSIPTNALRRCRKASSWRRRRRRTTTADRVIQPKSRRDDGPREYRSHRNHLFLVSAAVRSVLVGWLADYARSSALRERARRVTSESHACQRTECSPAQIMVGCVERRGGGWRRA